MFRTLTVVALLGAAGTGAAIIHAEQVKGRPTATASSGSSQAVRATTDRVARTAVPSHAPAAIDRALLDQYCVTCHNERLKTGGLSLEKLDVTQVAAHADVLEKI